MLVKITNIFYSESYTPRFNTPKSASLIQSQISNCERNITESLAQCASLVVDQNFQFQFSLKTFVDTITTCDIADTTDNIKKVEELFKECGTIIIQWEKKRRNFKAELKKVLDNRDRKEAVKRMTMRNTFKQKSLPLKIPSPPSSKE